MKYLTRITTTLIFSALVLFVLSCSRNAASSNQTVATEQPRETPPATSTTSAGQAASQSGSPSPILPDGKLTPGDTLDVTKDDICVSGYSKKVRDVPQAVKEQAYSEYGIVRREPGEYEVDHLISLELGGSNSIKNLWPESYRTSPWNARVKDKLENKLHEMICSGQVDIKAAQQAIAGNWIEAYKKYLGNLPGGDSQINESRSESNSARNQSALPKDINANKQLKADINSKANANSSNTTNNSSSANGAVIGNKNSHIYHLPGCPDYDKIALKNRVEFQSAKDAEAQGYRLAGNCHQK